MGLLRIATVVAIGVALLPSDKDQQQHLYDRASTAVSWAATFCDRNGPTCAKGSELWSQFVDKAEFGAKLAFDTMRERYAAAKDDPGDKPYTPAALRRETPLLERDRDTLTPHDRKPAWRGKRQDKGSI